MCRHLIVAGAVQGVGYRAWFREQALALRLSGWVRNRLDGTVEALVAGESGALDEIVKLARRGPPAARVQDVRVAEADESAVKIGRFEQLPTC
jgi:acylphosphatase